uniref:Uncharacterized protein n=1 Tax=Setaria viridis TaxID=4556 RepID=A0A4U6VN40_SETVI|nr:hypothetical protein SEVIR_2G041500v2 [Setaria viridis]
MYLRMEEVYVAKSCHILPVPCNTSKPNLTHECLGSGDNDSFSVANKSLESHTCIYGRVGASVTGQLLCTYREKTHVKVKIDPLHSFGQLHWSSERARLQPSYLLLVFSDAVNGPNSKVLMKMSCVQGQLFG